MYRPKWPFLLMYGSHDIRHTGFPRVDGLSQNWGVTELFGWPTETTPFRMLIPHLEFSLLKKKECSRYCCYLDYMSSWASVARYKPTKMVV